MKLVIHGKNIEITDAIREYVHQKIEKAVSHFQNITNQVDVHLSVARNPRISTKQAAEVTIYANGSVIRAEESSESLYASIDLVADKIARQLRKYKEKRQDHKTQPISTNEIVAPEPVAADLIGDRTPELPEEVVRTKYFSMPPMTLAEAQEQLQLVDTTFICSIMQKPEILTSFTNVITVVMELFNPGTTVTPMAKTANRLVLMLL
jgi:putative sigma-54 modulation protein